MKEGIKEVQCILLSFAAKVSCSVVIAANLALVKMVSRATNLPLMFWSSLMLRWKASFYSISLRRSAIGITLLWLVTCLGFLMLFAFHRSKKRAEAQSARRTLLLPLSKKRINFYFSDFVFIIKKNVRKQKFSVGYTMPYHMRGAMMGSNPGYTDADKKVLEDDITETIGAILVFSNSAPDESRMKEIRKLAKRASVKFMKTVPHADFLAWKAMEMHGSGDGGGDGGDDEVDMYRLAIFSALVRLHLKKDEEKDNTMAYVILGIVAGVIVIGLIVYAMRR